MLLTEKDFLSIYNFHPIELTRAIYQDATIEPRFNDDLLPRQARSGAVDLELIFVAPHPKRVVVARAPISL
jgi:hypothetical protein